MDTLATLSSLGLSLPSPAYLLGALVFGVIGLAAFGHGRKAAQARTKWLGLALMLYPYAITPTWLLYAVGTALCAALYYARD